eukprot:scaffold1203_cov74-Phaeocystis_antarctica.AAC.12
MIPTSASSRCSPSCGSEVAEATAAPPAADEGGALGNVAGRDILERKIIIVLLLYLSYGANAISITHSDGPVNLTDMFKANRTKAELSTHHTR